LFNKLPRASHCCEQLGSWGFVGKKPLGLCQFFHETQQFFELFEIPGTSDSLNLNFFRYLDLAFDSEHFQIPATGSSFDSDLF